MAESKKPNPQLSEETFKRKAKNVEFQRARGLESTKREVQRENINPAGEKSKKFDRDIYEKAMDARDAENEKNLSRNEPPKEKTIHETKKVSEPKKTISKGAAIKKATGKFFTRFVPVVGTAITVKEAYDFGKVIKETIIDAPPVQEQLQQLHQGNPEQSPEPPKIEQFFENSSNSTGEYKENIEPNINHGFEEQNFDEVSDIANEEMTDLVFTMDEIEKPFIEDEPIIIEEHEKDGVFRIMDELQNIGNSGFPKDLEPSIHEPSEIDMGDPSMDASDGSDGGADGGGDGGGSGGAGE